MTTLPASLIEDAARLDPDRTLATSFARPEARGGLIALILFNHEIARVRDVVSEPGLGHIRLHWWREVIEQIFTGAPVRRHPVAEALAATVAEHGLPRSLLDAMVDAREKELEGFPFATQADLDSWLDAAFGHLIRLSFLVCGASALSAVHETAARETGALVGKTVLLATLGVWKGRGACWLPEAERAGAGIAMAEGASIWPDASHAGLKALRQRMVVEVSAHRRAANAAIRALPAEHVPALIHAALAPGLARRAAVAAVPYGIPAIPPLLLRQIGLVTATARQRL